MSEPTTLRIPQDRETALSTEQTALGAALYLYSRSNDSIDANTVGQDYLTLRHDGANLAFVVCDGVGQSFMGDIAARLLGDALLDWLWQLKRPADAASLGAAVTAHLNEITGVTGKAVAEFRLPAGLPGLITQALEMQRSYGSEAMFVAGRISFEASSPWTALCWLGDAPVAAVDVDGDLLDLKPHGSTSERWNASSGIKGSVHSWLLEGSSLARVAGYTDGLGISGAPTDDRLAEIIRGWEKDPPGDDATLFDLRLAPSPATTGRPITAPAPEAPRPIEREAQPGPVEGWRSLSPESRPGASLPDAAGVFAALEMPTTLSEKEIEQLQTLLTSGGLSSDAQLQTWYNMMVMNLTGAALSALMMQRLMGKEKK